MMGIFILFNHRSYTSGGSEYRYSDIPSTVTRSSRVVVLGQAE